MDLAIHFDCHLATCSLDFLDRVVDVTDDGHLKNAIFSYFRRCWNVLSKKQSVASASFFPPTLPAENYYVERHLCAVLIALVVIQSCR